MHESLGEIVGQVLEAVGEAGLATEPSPRGPRWLRWGVTALLLIVVGLLTISLWWPR